MDGCPAVALLLPNSATVVGLGEAALPVALSSASWFTTCWKLLIVDVPESLDRMVEFWLERSESPSPLALDGPGRLISGPQICEGREREGEKERK